ncbi:MAG: hypothetical protein K2O62_01605, partial [Clostridia bacterium]|nr:hypothetical protein [Clostridia bacterium]
ANSNNSTYYPLATWTESDGYYPSLYTGAGTGNNYVFSADIGLYGEAASNYWLRPAGRNPAANSNALFVVATGCVTSNYVSASVGVRPAFNFNPDTVVYATAADLSSITSTFTSVNTAKSYADGKPAYKIYTKAEDYVNYNGAASGAPKMTTDGSTVTVEKSGQTGKAVFLLADNDNSGTVKYQAKTNFSGGKATATLPAGVKVGDYEVTVLFLDIDNGTEKSDIVKASYTAESLTIAAPSNITTTKAYDGNTAKPLAFNDTQHTLSYIASDWYKEAIYTDTDLMEVTYEYIAREDETSTFTKPQISGDSVNDGINAALKADPATASNLKNAGKYKVTLKLKTDSIKWSDDTLDYSSATDAQKELAKYRVVEYEIKPKEVNVSYSIYDTSGATPVEKSGATSVVYTTDTTKTYKVDIKTVVSTESIPTGTTNRFPDYEIVYSGTANDGTEYDEVSTAPRLAGSYTAKFKDKNS